MPHPHVTHSIHAPLLEQSIPDWLSQASPSHREALRNANAPLPAWYRQASRQQRKALDDSLVAHLNAQNQLAQALAGLQDVHAFAEPLLRRCLKTLLGVELDVNQTFLHLLQTVGVGAVLPIEIGAFEVSTMSLLQAALHNFEEAENEPDAFHRASGFVTRSAQTGSLEPVTTAMTVEDFILACRALDLGAQYQQHLKAVLYPDDPAALHTLRERFEAAQKTALRVAAERALLQNDIDPADHTSILAIIGGDRQPRQGGKPIRFCEMTLMDRPLNGCIGFTFGDPAEHPDDLLLYIPDDPHHPLKRYKTAQLETALRQQFTARDEAAPDDGHPTAYQRFFSRFVAYADRPYYFSQFTVDTSDASFTDRLATHFSLLHDLFNGLRPWPSTQLSHIPPPPTLRQVANPQPFLAPLFVPLDKDREDNVELWGCLFERYRQRMMADARSYAVPAAEIDAQVRKRLFARLLDIGMLVLGAVSMFVPVLGEVTMTLVACQLLEESIAGVVEWSEGDRVAATAHLLDVAQNLALMGLTAGAGKGLAKLTVEPAPAVIEDLHPVTLADGSTRLCRADLAGYEVPDLQAPATFEPDSGPDAEGRYELDDRTYIRIDGRVFEQTYDRDLKRWRIRHPVDPQAYQPVLTHNGAGAWRHVLENPLGWDRLKLLRRIGPMGDGWSDEQLLQIADISEASDYALRRMHMDNGLPPPELVDTFRLFSADRDVTQLIEQVVSGACIDERYLHVLPLVTELPQWPVGRTLQIFDNPGLTGGRVEYGHASVPPKPAIRLSRFDVLSGQMPARILQALDDNERAQLLGADAAREPVWHPQALREQIAASVRARRGSLFNQFYRRRTQAFPLIDKLQRVYPGLSDAAAQDILAHASGADMATLKSAEQVPRALHKEARWYVQRGRTSGARARQALGMADSTATLGQGPGKRHFNPPRRIRQNLLGYPASGEGMLGTSGLNIALVLRLQHLYPDLEMAEANGLILALMRSGQSDAQILQLLEQLREQWLALEQTLDSWVTQGGNVEHKAEVALSLRNTWRGRPFADENAAYRQLELVCDEPLPTLTADFSHVTTLRLHMPSATDQQIASLLRNFPGLINLDLRSNRLIANPIAQENAGSLLKLDLSDNPLYQLDVSAMTQLEVLNLAGTQLQEWPTGADTLWHLDWLDLRGTRIRELPPEALARDELLINTNLTGAPLSAATQQQLQLAWQRCEMTLGLPDGALERFFREPVPQHTARPFENGTLLASRLLLLPPGLPAELSTASFIRRLRRVDPGLTEGEAMVVIAGWRVGASDAWVNAHIEAWGQRFEVITRRLNGWIFSRRTCSPLYGGRWSASLSRSEAAQKILACWKRGLNETTGQGESTLDLSNIDGLGELPQLPAGFDHVQSLNLRGNGLTEHDLGGFLPTFSRLVSLDLSLNRMERLPQAVAGLAHLQELGLSSNRFSDLAQLAQDLGPRPRLESLRLSYNRIKAFNGAYLETLPGLRNLELNFNQMNRFDGPLTPLLQSLHLNGNDLRAWPDGVLEAPSLEVLNLAGNPINEIPVEAFDGSHDRLLAGTQLFGMMRYLSTASLKRLLGHLDRVGADSALGISRDNIERWLANPEWVAMEEGVE